MGVASATPEPQRVQARPCRACGVMVYDLLYERTGHLAPIEVAETPNARCSVDLEAGTYRLPGLDLRLPPDPHRHRNHFETCEFASRFRSKLPAR